MNKEPDYSEIASRALRGETMLVDTFDFDAPTVQYTFKISDERCPTCGSKQTSVFDEGRRHCFSSTHEGCGTVWRTW